MENKYYQDVDGMILQFHQDLEKATSIKEKVLVILNNKIGSGVNCFPNFCHWIKSDIEEILSTLKGMRDEGIIFSSKDDNAWSLWKQD